MAEFEQKPLFLTVAEALEQGYELCGDESQDFQHLSNITELDAADFQYKQLVVAEKESFYLSIDAGSVRDMVTDRVYDNDKIADDTDDIKDLLKDHVDWERIASEINEALKRKPYWNLTTIRLIP